MAASVHGEVSSWFVNYLCNLSAFVVLILASNSCYVVGERYLSASASARTTGTNELPTYLFCQ